VGWTPLQKKIIFFYPQNDKFGCFLTQFLTGRKHGQSLEAMGHGFYGSIGKRSLQTQCRNYQKFTVRQGGGRTIAPPPLNTPLVTAHPSIASVPTSYYSMWQLPLHSRGLMWPAYLLPMNSYPTPCTTVLLLSRGEALFSVISVCSLVWLSGNALFSIDVVTLHRARLVPGRVTV